MSIALKPLNWTVLVDTTSTGKSVVLRNLTWWEYQNFLEERGDTRPRFTYDHGSLELMPTSREHEVYLWLLGMFVVVLAEETGMPLSVGGQMTISREDLDRGIQPDGCFWIANAGRVQGKLDLDFTQDPPPDLVIEVEVSATILDRLNVLAALRVPEVWRSDGASVHVGLLGPEGEYIWGEKSAAFPSLQASEIARFLARATQQSDHLGIVRSFRVWVREQLGSQD